MTAQQPAGKTRASRRSAASGPTLPAPALATQAPAGSSPVRPQRRTTSITIESVVEGPDVERFYALYLAAFGALRTAAVARHVLHEDEFREEMADPRIDKYVVWDRGHRAIAMATFTRHLESVPWISPHYFAHHYPEQTARNAVFYLGFILVEPGRQRQHLFRELGESVIRRVVENRGVCGWDICAVNDETKALNDVICSMADGVAPIDVGVIDRQTYYVGVPEVSRPGSNLPRMRSVDP